jgi:hypothetical protein
MNDARSTDLTAPSCVSSCCCLGIVVSSIEAVASDALQYTQAAEVVVSSLVAAALERVRPATMGHPPSGVGIRFKLTFSLANFGIF